MKKYINPTTDAIFLCGELLMGSEGASGNSNVPSTDPTTPTEKGGPIGAPGRKVF